MKSSIIKIIIISLFTSLHIGVNNRLPEMLFAFHIAAFLFIGIVWLKAKDVRINLHPVSFIPLIFIFGLFIRELWYGNPFGSYRVYTTAILWLLFFPFSALQRSKREYTKFIAWTVVSIVAIEILWGLAQSIGLISNHDRQFAVGGSLGNPGAYAGCLGAVAPMILSLLLAYKKNRKYENLYYSLSALFLFLLYLLLVTKSRGAWIACAIGCSFVIVYRYKEPLMAAFHSKALKISALFSFVVLISAGGFFLYKIKEDSAFGRLLVWKVALSTSHENLFTGNGIGYFEAQYGKWQASYFAEKGGSPKEQYVADYVTTAYNEFIETALEQGFIMALLLGTLFIVTVADWRKSTLSTIELGAKSSVAAVFVLAWCSYPFKVMPVTLYFIFCLSVIFHKSGRRWVIKNRHAARLLQTGLIAVAGLIAYRGCGKAYGLHLLQQGQEQVMRQNNPDAAADIYRKAEKWLANDGEFYFYYGSACFLAGKNIQAIEALTASCRLCANPNSFLLLGNVYKTVGETHHAVEVYKTAAYMQPMRLYPKYLLANLYHESGDLDNTRRWASEILETTEKVPTTAAKEMKEDMKQLLQKLDKQKRNDDK